MTDVAQWRCSTCDFALYVPVSARLRLSHVGLYSDRRFPGRALVAFERHETALEDLSDRDRDDFWSDVATVGRAVRRVTGAPRVNYAVLGNADPHLHAHVIPRLPAREPLPTRPPWNDPRSYEEMDLTSLQRLRKSLANVLA